jgi:hypothetical protein
LDAEGLNVGSGEGIGNDMEIDSGDNAQEYVVAERQGHEVVMEELAKTHENVVEKFKSLEPQQLVKANELMSGAIRD